MANARCQHHAWPKLVPTSTLPTVSGSRAAAAEPAILAVTPSTTLSADNNATIAPTSVTRRDQASKAPSALPEVVEEATPIP